MRTTTFVAVRNVRNISMNVIYIALNVQCTHTHIHAHRLMVTSVFHGAKTDNKLYDLAFV